MSLRYIVPSLGLIACAAGTASAADVGGLTINGYVDTVLEITSVGDDLAVTESGAATINGDDASNIVIDWSAAAQIEVGYAIGDVNADIEVYWDGTNVVLEQAYADWMINPQFDIKMGRFHNGLSLEEDDAPDLYRVNTSIIYLADDIDGVRAGFKANDMFGGGITLCDGYFDAEVDKDTDEFGIGVDATVVAEGIGSFTGNLIFDQGTAFSSEDGETDDTLVFEVFGKIDALQESQKMLFGFDVVYLDAADYSVYGGMAMGNYQINDMAAVTLMLSYLNIDVDDGTIDESGSEMEIAVALLTNPTNEKNFALNVEARYIGRDYEDLGGGDDSDEFGVFLEMIAQIP